MIDKKYDFNKVEDGKYDFWLKNNLFSTKDNSKKPFSIILPPPNITGKLHIGHAFDVTLQDIIIRYKKLKGFDTLWLPGMDHAAIATESKVVSKLKEKGINKYDYGREKFLDACWDWKTEHSTNIRKQWARLGLALDYTNERFTLDEYSQDAVFIVFKKMYDEGLIYRGEKIINWDPVAKTALSNEEVIYKEEEGKLYYIKYYLENKKDYITVATTRCETIFGDTAVAVNPKDERYKNLVGKKVYVPLTSRLINIIEDDSVVIDFGTGALKITPAHALEDYEIGLRHNLEIIKTIKEDGSLNELTGKYNNLNILDARKEIVKDLINENLLVKEESYIHSVGYSERTNALVEPFLSKQWFVKMKELSKRVLDNQKTSNKVEFIPKRFEKILNNWMTECKDWCISRQLWWGIRIPVWYCGDEVIVSKTSPKEGFIQDTDVLDTWFSSALWPFSTLKYSENDPLYNRYFPTNVLVTAYDIIFFWVARMIFQSLYVTNKIPFKDCLIHGLIRDSQGRKMSKSLGNGIDPMDMIDKYGCDSIRYYISTSAALGMDLSFNEEKVSSSWNFINKLWNASRYVLTSIDNISNTDINYEQLDIEEKWILTHLNNTIKNVTLSMDKYRFNDVNNYIYDFTWNYFCSWYIELSKRKITDPNTLSVLYKVLLNILEILHPFMPFVTEEIYLSLPFHKQSIMLENYPIYNKKEVFDIKEFSCLLQNITTIRTFKLDNKITKDSQQDIETSDKYLQIVNFILRVNNTENSYDSTLKCTTKTITATFKVPNSNNENILLELQKEKDLLINSIEKRKTLLNNDSYVKNAPAAIVQMDKDKLNKEQERLSIINETLK